MNKIVNNKDIILIDELNQKIKQDSKQLVNFSESYYFNQIENVCNDIIIKNYKIILLAGPSASGKTTTAEKIKQVLEQKNKHSAMISLDNFFFNREALPILKDGTKDFDSINTIDTDCWNNCISQLLNENQAEFPIFDFVSGKRLPQRLKIKLDNESIIIVEGIHALHEKITQNYEDDFYKIYASVGTDYYDEKLKEVLGSQDIRLIRRIIRDYTFRNTDPELTLDMWKNVCDSENFNLRPYKKNADFFINTLHFYEPALYHHWLIPLLDKVSVNNKYYNKCVYLKDILNSFKDLPDKYVPDNSMLKEFLT